MKLAAKLILVLSPGLNACATNPATGDRDLALISKITEIEQGCSYHEQMIASYGVCADLTLQQYVR